MLHHGLDARQDPPLLGEPSRDVDGPLHERRLGERAALALEIPVRLFLLVAGVRLQGALETGPLPHGNEDDAVGEKAGGHQAKEHADPLPGAAAEEAVAAVGVDGLGLDSLALGDAAGSNRRRRLGRAERQLQVERPCCALGRVGDLVLVLQRALHLAVQAVERSRVGGGQVLALRRTGQVLQSGAVEVAALQADGEDGGVGTLGRALGLVEGGGGDRVLPVAQ